MGNILQRLARILQQLRHEEANREESNKQSPPNDESKEEGFTCEISVEPTPFPQPKFNSDMKKWKRCPVCSHLVELREGCWIVNCRCGIKFCYKCRKQVYEHRCDCDSNTNSNSISQCCGWFFLILVVVGVLALFAMVVVHLINFVKTNSCDV